MKFPKEHGRPYLSHLMHPRRWTYFVKCIIHIYTQLNIFKDLCVYVFVCVCGGGGGGGVGVLSNMKMRLGGTVCQSVILTSKSF